jgi:hypothetical protein
VKISVVSTVPYPRDEVYVAMCEQLPALAEFMPNIDKVVCEDRQTPAEGIVDLVNRWHASASEVPAVARKFVKPEQMNWIDRAHWDKGAWRCDWNLEMGFLTERIKCSGSTTYHETAGGTEMHIEGTLEIDLAGMMPKFLLNKAQPAIEGFVGRTIEPNFQKTADALTRYLDAKHGK